MSDSAGKTGRDLRVHERALLDDQVTVELLPGTLVGDGENLSDQGIYLRAGTQIPVRVRIGAGGELREGALVRVETIGDGSFGIAIRFDPPA